MGRGLRPAIVLVLALLVLAPAAHGALTAESMFEPSTVVSVKLALPEKSVKKLEEEPKKYVKGTFSLAETDGTPASVGPFSTPIEVGIKLKGSLGSLRRLSEKAAFKVSFGKYVEGQTFLGLEKLTLNNMVQDASMVHETLSYDLFRANRVAGSHTGFAYLHVNLAGSEADFGLYLNIETLEKVALEKRFGPFLVPPQHLYEGEYEADVTPAGESKFEVDEGEEEHREDLEALVAAVGGTVPADFSERVAPYADLQEMVHEWAVEKYVGHWDSYAGEQGSLRPNNYYLYSSATGVFQMLPWGTDQTWVRTVGFAGAAGVLFDECLADPSCATMYRRALRELLASLPSLGLDSLATGTASLLAPWQALEEAPRRTNEAGEIHAAVEATRSFARNRPGELEAFLAGQPGEARATRVAVSLAPSTLPAGGGAGRVTALVTGAASEPIFGDGLSFSAPGLSFGPTVDEGEGLYTATFTGTPAPGATKVTATDATAGILGTATLTVEAPTGGGTTSAPPRPVAVSPAPPIATPPRVTFGGSPGHRTHQRRPLFRFASTVPGSTFVCRLGSRPFRACDSPLRLPRLGAGRHVLGVAAIGPEGTRGDVRSYRFVVSIRSRTRVPDGPLSIATSSHS